MAYPLVVVTFASYRDLVAKGGSGDEMLQKALTSSPVIPRFLRLHADALALGGVPALLQCAFAEPELAAAAAAWVEQNRPGFGWFRSLHASSTAGMRARPRRLRLQRARALK